jgi:hypothetical protein
MWRTPSDRTRHANFTHDLFSGFSYFLRGPLTALHYLLHWGHSMAVCFCFKWTWFVSQASREVIILNRYVSQALFSWTQRPLNNSFSTAVSLTARSTFYTLHGIWRSQSGLFEEYFATCLHAGVLLGLFILRPWKWRRYVPPKRRLTLNGLQGVISLKIVLFIFYTTSKGSFLRN